MAKVYTYKRPKDLKQTFKKLMSYLGHHRWTLLIVAILVVISSLANLLGTFSIKIVVQYALDANVDGLLTTCIVVGLCYILGAVATLGYTQIMVYLAQKVVYEMRRDVFKNLQKLPVKYFDNTSNGDIMSVFTSDVETVSEALNNSFASTVEYFVQLVGTTICIFVLSWFLSLLVMVFYVIMAVYLVISGKKSKYYFKMQQNTLGELSGYTEEAIQGMKVIKVFNHEQESLKEFKNVSTTLSSSSYHALSFSNSMVPMVMSLSYFNYAIVAVVGGIAAMNSFLGFSIPSLASYLVFTRQTTIPINRFTQQANIILNALASAERIFALAEEKPEINEGTFTLVEKEENGKRISYWKDGDKLIKVCGDVRFNDVSFGYNKDKMILKHLSLYAKPGQKIAFVGSTGAGKTTITNLINRFYDVDEGEITFDSINIKNIEKKSLRQALGMVLQDTHLFAGTIMENIRFGKLDATREEVIAACKLANADSFIKRLPNGYDTVISSDGENLSQGQRQLLAIARAAVSNPEVLILDEATSSVDTYTEKLIQRGMDKLMENRTVFVIAHRLSTVRNADAIIVLENGEIIERGNHDELLKLKGHYYQLCTGNKELS